VTIHRRGFLAGAAALGLNAAAAGGARGSADPAAPLAAQAIRADLKLIGEAYGLLHPGLGRYLPPGGFDRLIEAEIGWASHERSAGDVYLMLSRLTAAVRCGHTHANPANQSKRVQRELIGRADRLPFCTGWIEGRMIVTDPLASGLARGSEVRAVDGVAARRLLAEMLPYTRADGHNDGKRRAQLELHRGDRFAAFDVLRPLLHAPEQPGSVQLDIRDPAGRRRALTIATAAEGARGTAARSDSQYGWRFAIGSEGVGVLTMPDWSLYNSEWDWRGYLREVIDTLVRERARGLVIDLRENEGGLDCGDVLIAGLTDRPIAPPPARRLVRFRETPASLRPVLDTWDSSFHRLGAEAPPASDRPGFFDLGAREEGGIAPAGQRYAGKVAVLIGPTCSSATFQFADLVQRNGLGTLVGSSTGGNRRGINGGCFFFLRLPETGFEVDLPLIGYFPSGSEPDAGLDPDIRVPRRVSDVVAGTDAALAVARRLCLG
jgi:hypothetical protein